MRPRLFTFTNVRIKVIIPAICLHVNSVTCDDQVRKWVCRPSSTFDAACPRGSIQGDIDPQMSCLLSCSVWLYWGSGGPDLHLLVATLLSREPRLVDAWGIPDLETSSLDTYIKHTVDSSIGMHRSVRVYRLTPPRDKLLRACQPVIPM